MRAHRLSDIPIRKGATSSARHYSSLPPRKSYSTNGDLVKYIWYQTIPPTFKYFSGIGLSAWGLIHVHPDVLITVLPPVITGGYFAYKGWMKHQWRKHTSKILPKTEKELGQVNGRVRIRKYDESDIRNLDYRIESAYDNLTKQILELVELRLIDFVSSSNRKDSLLSQLMDDNNQITINIDKKNIETFVSTKVKYNMMLKETREVIDDVDLSQEVSFVTFSVPLMSGKFSRRSKRIGTIQISLLEIPKEESTTYEEYEIGTDLIPFSLVTGSRKHISIDNDLFTGIQKSSILMLVQNSDEAKNGTANKTV